MKVLPRGARKVLSIAIGHESCHLIGLTEKWLRCNGAEWTVKRLKAIRTGAYQLRAENTSLAREIWQENSISYDHSTLIPKGPWGQVVRRFLAAENGSVIRRCDMAMRVYTCIYSSTLTHTQYNKAYKAINLKPNYTKRTFDITCKAIHDFFKTPMGREIKYIARKVKYQQSYDDGKYRIDLSRVSPFSATHREQRSQDVETMPWGKHVCSLWTSVYLPESLASSNPAEAFRKELISSNADNVTCGHISFIQEGGCKARVVAVPNIWIQMHMQILDKILDVIIKTLPCSCSHEQNKGAYGLRSRLTKGKSVYCFDLSSATDRFPLEYQLIVLNELGLNDFANAIDEISHGQWKVNTPFGKEVWSYQTGQPMGMYGSFKLFHLTHIILLAAITIYCRKKAENCFSPFLVLGDDVIIADRNVAKMYKSVIRGSGVEVSPTKSIVSNKIGEFAGFTAIKTNKSVVVYRPFKYSGKQGYGAALPFFYNAGKRCRSISPWYALKYEQFRHTVGNRNPDLSPLISQDKDLGFAGRLNSHLLGSMSNRLSFFITLDFTQDIFEMYEEQQIIILGQNEKVNEDGFASAVDNCETAIGQDLDIPLDTQISYSGVFNKQVSADPLMVEQVNMFGATVNNDQCN